MLRLAFFLKLSRSVCPMNAWVLAKLAEVGACTPGCKLVTWPWSVAFAAAKAASWDISLIIGSAVAAMFAACCPLVLTMVDMKAVDSTRESQQLCSASGRLFGRELTAALVASGRLFERESTAALVVSGRLLGREAAVALFSKSDGSRYLETVQVC